MSQEQKSGTFPRDLTTWLALRMMRKSSARRRRGLTRDVLRTSVSVVGQPSQRAGWGAIARAGVGLPASRRRPGRPSCRSAAGRLAGNYLDKDRLLDRSPALCDYPR